MAIRQIIEIDEDRCTGCGECATGCPEGALRIIEGKARLVGESLCDGLGACIGTCPFGAITITEREAEEYVEAKVMEGMVKLGPAVLTAHLEHLAHHGQELYVRQALAWLDERNLPLPEEAKALVATLDQAGPRQNLQAAPDARPAERAATEPMHLAGCPGSAPRRFRPAKPAAASRLTSSAASNLAGTNGSSDGGGSLSSWPIQLHLVNPRSPQFADADILIAADCTAFSLGSFHSSLLEGRSLAIACPKLDQGREIYVDKLATILANARSVTVAIMEVPCCSGLLQLVMDARERGTRRPTINAVVLGIQGGILKETVN